MLSVADLEVGLSASEGQLRGKVQKGELIADHAIEIGARACDDFSKDSPGSGWHG